MRNRHLTISALMLVLLVSVLFLSCGIPSSSDFISMETITMSASTSNSDLIISFLNHEDNGEIMQIEKGPSLLLAYAIGEGTTEDSAIPASNRESLVNSFKTFVDNQKVPYLEGKAIASSSSYNLYPFMVLKNSEFHYPSSPYYSFEMSKIRTEPEWESDGSSKKYMEYISNKLKIRFEMLEGQEYLTEEGYKGYYYKVSYADDSSDSNILSVIPQGKLPENSRIYIFACISPGVGDFKFPTWSSACYIGSFSIPQ